MGAAGQRERRELRVLAACRDEDDAAVAPIPLELLRKQRGESGRALGEATRPAARVRADRLCELVEVDGLGADPDLHRVGEALQESAERVGVGGLLRRSPQLEVRTMVA